MEHKPTPQESLNSTSSPTNSPRTSLSRPAPQPHQPYPTQNPSGVSGSGSGSGNYCGSSYEEDISPRSHQASSLHRPTVPDLADSEYESNMAPTNGSGSAPPPPSLKTAGIDSNIFHDAYSPASAHPGIVPDTKVTPPAEEYSPTNDSSELVPTVAFPLPGAGGESRRDSSRLYAERPSLARLHSDEPLMHDVSGANTPYDPSGMDRNPFEGGSVDLEHSPHSSVPSSPDLVAVGASSLAPKIQLNSRSIPPSPAQPQESTFEPRASFAAPFADGLLSSGSGSGSGSHSNSQDSSFSKSAGGESYLDNVSLNSGKDISSRISSIQARRSQRMKNRASQKAVKKDRDGKPVQAMNRKPFESTRLKGEIYKPWLEKRDPAQRWARWITIVSIILGFAAAGAICYDGYAAVPNLGKTCLVMEDNFDTLNTDTWEREVRLDGYGNGEFEWTTASPNNSFVDNGVLYLVPTLTSDHLGADAVTSGYTLNLTADGTCTSTNVSQCVAVSNTSKLTVINPVMSARLTTKHSVSLRYGKVEVRAKFPTGDWLWPSIFMLPVNETYGAWPRSGEIDIVTGRGNNASYPSRGVDYAQSSLHWGPTVDLDRLWMTWGYREQRRQYYNQAFHTYGLEWNDKYMWTYIDSRVSQVISLRFNKESFWQRGKFPTTITNTTTGDIIKLLNPWATSTNNVAPYDQSFYLILNLAVGATSGWFPDGEGGKPWIDGSASAMSDFWAAKDKWWSNWPSDPKKRGMAVESVKMWKTC